MAAGVAERECERWAGVAVLRSSGRSVTLDVFCSPDGTLRVDGRLAGAAADPAPPPAPAPPPSPAAAARPPEMLPDPWDLDSCDLDWLPLATAVPVEPPEVPEWY